MNADVDIHIAWAYLSLEEPLGEAGVKVLTDISCERGLASLKELHLNSISLIHHHHLFFIIFFHLFIHSFISS